MAHFDVWIAIQSHSAQSNSNVLFYSGQSCSSRMACRFDKTVDRSTISFETAGRSTGFVLIFDRMTMFKRFSDARTFLSTAYDILLLLTSHLLESIDAFAASDSVTKQPSVQMSQNATSAEKVTNTIEIARMLSNAPIVTPNTWLVHRNVQ